MAGIPDVDAHKIYIGNELPKDDRSSKYLKGDRPYEGTLAVAGPTYIGGHSGNGNGTLNVGTDIDEWKPKIAERAVDIEGDVNVTGKKGPNHVYIEGNVYVTGTVDCLSTGRLESRHKVADSLPKPFDMVHPSKGRGHRLRYACIEGPEVGVYFRGRTHNNVIPLPDYWKDLVLVDSITVQTQAVGSTQNIIIKEWNEDRIILEGVTDCFFHVYAERKDVNPLVVEYEGDTWEDYPDPEYNDSAFAR
tara:strand:+ start:2926 stop:3666 length:741 start_codon:yes stop_codon:yes gene_type:complete